jgi:cell division protein FtsB
MGEIRRRARFVVVPILGTLMIGYFGYHALTGERSLITLWLVKQRLVESGVVFERVSAERARLQNRVDLMTSEHIDPDMLDERVRWTLDYVAPGDLVIFRDRGQESP